MRKEYLNNGNGKLNKGFMCLNMGDFESCCKDNPDIMKICEAYNVCYTDPENTFYKSNPQIRKEWLKDTAEEIAKAIQQKINRRRKNIVEYIRVNERGEVLNQGDINKLYRVCRLLPRQQFTIYTTRSDLKWKDKPDNLILIESGHRNIPERTKSKIANATDVDYTCNWTVTGKKCNQGCTHCYTNNNEDIAIKFH